MNPLAACEADFHAIARSIAGLQQQLAVMSGHLAQLAVTVGAKVTETDLARVAQIQALVASEYGVTVYSLTGHTRPARIAWPRLVAMALAADLTSVTHVDIGKAFGGRHHGTVSHALKVVRNRCETEAGEAGKVERLRRKLL